MLDSWSFFFFLFFLSRHNGKDGPRRLTAISPRVTKKKLHQTQVTSIVFSALLFRRVTARYMPFLFFSFVPKSPLFFHGMNLQYKLKNIVYFIAIYMKRLNSIHVEV